MTASGWRLIPRRAMPLLRAMSAQQLSEEESGDVQGALSALSPADSRTLRACFGVLETLCDRLEAVSTELADVKDSLDSFINRLDEEGVTHDLQAIHAANVANVLMEADSQPVHADCEQQQGREGGGGSFKAARVIKQHLKQAG